MLVHQTVHTPTAEVWQQVAGLCRILFCYLALDYETHHTTGSWAYEDTSFVCTPSSYMPTHQICSAGKRLVSSIGFRYTCCKPRPLALACDLGISSASVASETAQETHILYPHRTLTPSSYNRAVLAAGPSAPGSQPTQDCRRGAASQTPGTMHIEKPPPPEVSEATKAEFQAVRPELKGRVRDGNCCWLCACSRISCWRANSVAVSCAACTRKPDMQTLDGHACPQMTGIRTALMSACCMHACMHLNPMCVAGRAPLIASSLAHPFALRQGRKVTGCSEGLQGTGRGRRVQEDGLRGQLEGQRGEDRALGVTTPVVAHDNSQHSMNNPAPVPQQLAAAQTALAKLEKNLEKKMEA